VSPAPQHGSPAGPAFSDRHPHPSIRARLPHSSSARLLPAVLPHFVSPRFWPVPLQAIDATRLQFNFK